MSDTTIDNLIYDCMEQGQINNQYLKSALYDLILKEVVGEDVPFSLAREMEMGELDLSARKLESQNSLRATQRNKLKELFDE